MNGDNIRRIALLVLVLGSAAWMAASRGEFDMAVLETWVKGAGPLGPVIYMLMAISLLLTIVMS